MCRGRSQQFLPVSCFAVIGVRATVQVSNLKFPLRHIYSHILIHLFSSSILFDPILCYLILLPFYLIMRSISSQLACLVLGLTYNFLSWCRNSIRSSNVITQFENFKDSLSTNFIQAQYLKKRWIMMCQTCPNLNGTPINSPVIALSLHTNSKFHSITVFKFCFVSARTWRCDMFIIPGSFLTLSQMLVKYLTIC